MTTEALKQKISAMYDLLTSDEQEEVYEEILEMLFRSSARQEWMEEE